MGKPYGRNGIVVWKADGVTVDNLTACNFLGGTGDSGNEIWWNGGADSGQIGLHGYSGSYLTGTSTFFSTNNNAAEYGIFSSNSSGPASWNQIYGSNMNDSGTYVGACKQECDITIDHAWMEYSALGYSGTNSGGAIVIENSQFDNNKDGFDTNTQIGGDPPAPQNGACPNGGTSPITHTHSCWVLIHNYFHNNNNPNVPGAGFAGQAPTGTGMTLSGGRNDTVMDNPSPTTVRGDSSWSRSPTRAPRWTTRPARAAGASSRRCSAASTTRRTTHSRQHVQPQRVLQEPVERRLRGDHHQRRSAVELLPRQHGTERELTCGPRAVLAHLRGDDDRGAGHRPAPGAGAV